jgi:hypothetical protein
MTPSELLAAAADRIRDLAAAAQPGPWRSFPSPDMPGETVVHAVTDRAGEPHPHRALTAHGLLCAEADAAWVAALSPAVAPTAEAILRAAAAEYDDDAQYRWMRMQNSGGFNDQWVVSGTAAAALALARLLCPELAEETP